MSEAFTRKVGITGKPFLVPRRPKPPRKTEAKISEEMCWIIHDWETDKPLPPESNPCKVLRSALFSAKTTLPKGSPRNVFIQDLAASLNRKNMLDSHRVDEFNKLGYEYMEAV